MAERRLAEECEAERMMDQGAERWVAELAVEGKGKAPDGRLVEEFLIKLAQQWVVEGLIAKLA